MLVGDWTSVCGVECKTLGNQVCELPGSASRIWIVGVRYSVLLRERDYILEWVWVLKVHFFEWPRRWRSPGYHSVLSAYLLFYVLMSPKDHDHPHSWCHALVLLSSDCVGPTSSVLPPSEFPNGGVPPLLESSPERLPLSLL